MYSLFRLGSPEPDLARRCQDRKLGRPTARHLCSLMVTIHWLVLYPLALFFGGEKPLTDYIDFPANWIVYDMFRLFGERAFGLWAMAATVTYGVLGWALGAAWDYFQCWRFRAKPTADGHDNKD